jgi:arylsulfatase A-like enzyme
MLRLLVLAVSAVSAITPAVASETSPTRPPNIVLIIGDDLGYPYAGFMGNEIVYTPNLDRLAEEGVTFTHAFSPASVCQPSMQTLLSGLHPRSWEAQRRRIESNIGEMLPIRGEVPHYVTLPRQLARQGYRSFQGGKHWEGDFAMAGFDAGTTIDARVFPPDWFQFGRPSLGPMYDFLDSVEDDEPFMLFLGPMLPHTPHDPPAELRNLYAGMGLANSAVSYYANVTRFDRLVGLTVAALEERGLREDTLIIYVSDNGWEQAPYVVQDDTWFERILGGSRGKFSIYDLGFRTPLVFNWPGHVPDHEQRGDLVTFRDLYATVLQYTGAPIPPDLEGDSLISRIEGDGEPARDHLIGGMDYLRARPNEFVFPLIVAVDRADFLRTDQWRYIEWLDRGTQALYRIDEDPLERNDLAAQYPTLLDVFAARTAAWRAELAEPASWMDLTGRLLTADQTSGRGLRLWLDGVDTSSTSREFEVFSNSDGFFRFPNVPAGHYKLTYEIETPKNHGRRRRAQAASATESLEIDLVGYETAPFLSLEIPEDLLPSPKQTGRPATLDIQILDPSGSQPAGIPVEVQGWTDVGFVRQRVLSGPEGFVAIDQLPAGFYRINVSPKHRRHRKLRSVYLRPGVREFLEIEVDLKVSKRGRKWGNSGRLKVSPRRPKRKNSGRGH